MSYNKGTRFERQLANLFRKKGFAVVRSAGSGVDAESPDLVVLGPRMKIGIECKVRTKGRLNISAQKIEVMKEWEKRAGMPLFIAWKITRKGWKFFPLNIFRKAKINYFVLESDQKSALTEKQLFELF